MAPHNMEYSLTFESRRGGLQNGIARIDLTWATTATGTPLLRVRAKLDISEVISVDEIDVRILDEARANLFEVLELGNWGTVRRIKLDRHCVSG